MSWYKNTAKECDCSPWPKLSDLGLNWILKWEFQFNPNLNVSDWGCKVRFLSFGKYLYDEFVNQLFAVPKPSTFFNLCLFEIITKVVFFGRPTLFCVLLYQHNWFKPLVWPFKFNRPFSEIQWTQKGRPGAKKGWCESVARSDLLASFLAQLSDSQSSTPSCWDCNGGSPWRRVTRCSSCPQSPSSWATRSWR